MGAKAVRELTGAPIAILGLDAEGVTDFSRNAGKLGIVIVIANRSSFVPPDILLEDGQEIAVGSLVFRVMRTPGHTPGSCCYLCGNVIFSGDTLFLENCGRCDLPGGDHRAMLRSLDALASLPGDYDVYPGHGPATTLEHERKRNRYIGSGDV